MQGSGSISYEASEGQHYDGRSGGGSQRNGMSSQRGGMHHPRGRGGRGQRGSERRGSGRGYDRYEREGSETSERGGRDRGGRGERRGSVSYRGRGGGGGRYEDREAQPDRYPIRGNFERRGGERRGYGSGRRGVSDDGDHPHLDDHRLNGLRNGGPTSSGSSSSVGVHEEAASGGPRRSGKGSDAKDRVTNQMTLNGSNKSTGDVATSHDSSRPVGTNQRSGGATATTAAAAAAPPAGPVSTGKKEKAAAR